MNRTRIAALVLPAAVALGAAAPAAEDTAADLRLAQREFDGGRYWKAAGILRELLADRPGLVEAEVELLRAEFAQGRIEEADAIDAGLAERHPDAATAPRAVLIARAALAFDRGRRDDAEHLAHVAAERDPDDLEARFLLARSLRERGARAAAEAEVEAAVAGRRPADLDADGLLHLGRLFGLVGRLELAAEACVHAERRRRDEGRPVADVLVTLGDFYRASRQLDGGQPRAFSTYRDALEENPSLVAAKVGRAHLHLYTFASHEAEKEIDEALAINPRAVEALVLKAWFRVTDGRYADALERLDQALEVDPAHKRARSVRAAALYLLDRNDDYEAEVARVLELDPTHGALFLDVGDALSAHLRHAEAVPFHRRALELDPELGLAWISLGRDLCFSNDETGGREALERSLDVDRFAHPWRHNMLLVLGKFEREFVDRASEAFLLRLHVDESPLMAARLENALQQDRVTLSERYGPCYDQPVLVEMFPVHQDFSVRTVGFAGLGAVGACFGPLVTLLSPRSELRGGFVWRRTALHELAHVFTIHRSKARVPRWLGEGLSVYEEFRAHPTWGRDQEVELLDAVANDALIPLREFNSVFRGPRVMFGYYQAGLFVDFVVRHHGFEKILEMLDGYADDLEDAEVVERVFGVVPEELDRRFREDLLATRLAGLAVQPNYGAHARARLRREAEAHPEDAGLLAEVAWAYLQAGLEVDADVYLEKALRVDPTNGAGLRLAARRAVARGRDDLARRHLEDAFANGGEEYHSAMLLARLCIADGDGAAAESALRRAKACFAADTGPGNPYVALHRLLTERGDVDAAMRELEEFVARSETAVGERLVLARHRLERDEHEAALAVLREAADVDPFLREVHRLQAQALRGLGRLDEAVAALRDALLVDPRLEPGYAPPASPEARDEETEKERERQVEILLEIVEIEFEAGDLTSARRDLERALTLAPESSRALELKERLDP